MNRITVLAVGKVKEKYFRDAISEYAKRLGAYCRLEIAEVADEKTPDRASEAEEKAIRDTEGKRLLQKIPASALVVTLEIKGKMMDSVALSEWIGQKNLQGNSHLCFVIGGSLGLSEEVCRRADFTLSFGPMTYPHQLMRVILLEQLYRAFRIRAGEPYHK